MQHRERGATPTQIAIGAAVLCFIFIAWLNSGGGFGGDYHAELAEDCCEALIENKFEVYGESMWKVWEEEVEENSWQAYYAGIMAHAGGKDGLKRQFQKLAKTQFDAVRKQASKVIDWSDADFDGAVLNTESVSSEHKLRGFYLEAGGKRYLFKFTKPKRGLHLVAFAGEVRS